MASYTRAVTVRVRAEYIVQECKAGALQEEAIELCGRLQKHLGSRKGVMYRRSRAQCEGVPQELRCAHYHVGGVDNEEWLET